MGPINMAKKKANWVWRFFKFLLFSGNYGRNRYNGKIIFLELLLPFS
jgi:hypothetical protein